MAEGPGGTVLTASGLSRSGDDELVADTETKLAHRPGTQLQDLFGASLRGEPPGAQVLYDLQDPQLAV